MVIKERDKRVKSLHKAEGFMLLEVVILIGFAVMLSVAATTLHSLIMISYRETDNRLQALSYAENVLASALTGKSYLIPTDFFKSSLSKIHVAPFLPVQKLSMAVTVTVTWHEKGQEKKVQLTRLVLEEQVRA